MKLLYSFIAVFIVSISAQADPESDRAIEEVQKMMQQPDFKTKANKNSKEAGAVAEHVTNLSGGGANEQDIYKMAAEILGNMKGNSPEEIAKILDEAKKNPEAFVRSWTPEQQEKLKQLSERMPAANKAKP